FVESDWVFATHSTVASALAGLDIEMPIGFYYAQPLIDAVNGGQLAESVVDAAVRRILRTQLCFRLDTDPPKVDPSQVNTQAHADLAREAEQKSIVLLKNANATLPLRRTAVRSIAVVGTLAGTANIGDFGSSVVLPTHVVTPLAGLQAAAGGV